MREDLNMGIKRTCQCDKCGKLLEETKSGMPINGYVILGNIHVSSLKDSEVGIGGGLIGNNLVGGDVFAGERATVVNHSFYCPDCLLDALYLNQKVLTR